VKDHLRVLVDFHAWQGELLLDAAERVTPENIRGTSLNNGTLFEMLWHILDVSWSWRCATEGLPGDEPSWEGQPIEDLATLRAAWRAEDDRLRSLVASWSTEDLEGTVTPSWRPGQPFKRWQVVMHIVTHQSDTANEVGWALTRLGQSPGEIGFMQYVNTHRDASGL
jgi:uncharacterized damage-inducible protein DinB